MLSFNDEELATITELAEPLAPGIRGEFLQLIANRIAECSQQERGSGLVHRIAVESQQVFLKRSLQNLAAGAGSH